MASKWVPIDDEPWDAEVPDSDLVITEQGKIITFVVASVEIEIDLHDKRICKKVATPDAAGVPVEVREAIGWLAEFACNPHNRTDESLAMAFKVAKWLVATKEATNGE